MTSHTVDARVDPREPRPPRADEATTLVAFLRWHRLTFEYKCRGLSPEDLSRRAVSRSALSLLGLVRHLAEGERFWFRRVMAGEDPPALYSTVGPDTAFDVRDADEDMVASAWADWRDEVAFAEKFVAGAVDLDVVGEEPGGGPVSLRWVLLHMIEEYARHNGHADLLREQIDGVTGL
ncbi:DinB family protein [Luedemannella flava]|uniref:DinB family protein n=1 Tax=Luedemannella flava TaxID=349316 RepID=A0ABN2LWG4_9ACTN